MNIITNFNQLILSEWIWGMTWGWGHLPLTIFVMFMLLRLTMKINIVPAIILPIAASTFSVAVYTLYVSGGFFSFLNMQSANVVDPLQACLYLAFIYTVLQSSFFCLLNCLYRLDLKVVLIVTVISNLLSALLIYELLPAM